jgi:hypothetical protein
VAQQPLAPACSSSASLSRTRPPRSVSILGRASRRPSSHARAPMFSFPLSSWRHGLACQYLLPSHDDARSPFQNHRRPNPPPNPFLPYLEQLRGYISRCPASYRPIPSPRRWLSRAVAATTLPRHHRPPYQAQRRFHPSHALDLTLGEFAVLLSIIRCFSFASSCFESWDSRLQ